MQANDETSAEQANDEIAVAQENTLPEPTAQAAFRGGIWLKAVLAALAFMSPALAIGLARDFENPADDDGYGWSLNVLLQVVLPGFLVYAGTNAVTSRVTTVLGFATLREKGAEVCVKESIRTNMTNNGVVLALFLTMLLAMWQANPNETPHARTEMWYRLLLLFGMEACTRGVVMVSLFLLFLEPLGGDGPTHFAVDNMLYLGEPCTCIGLTMVYFLQACVVWVFMIDAKVVGCLAFMVFGYCITRALVVAQYLQAWQSPAVSVEVRAARRSKLSLCQAVDGTG